MMRDLQTEWYPETFHYEKVPEPPKHGYDWCGCLGAHASEFPQLGLCPCKSGENSLHLVRVEGPAFGPEGAILTRFDDRIIRIEYGQQHGLGNRWV